MHPIFFHVGDTAIHSYGVMGAVGFLVVCFISLRRAQQIGLPKERVADVIFWTSVAGLFGSRALYVLQHPEQLPGPADWVNLRTGGLVFYGAMITGLPATGLLLRYYKLPFFKMMDIFATGLPLGHAISRVGCYLAGCCFGLPTDGPLGVTYSHPLSVAPRGIAMHPTQLYEVAMLLGITGIATWFYARKKFDGQVMLLYLTLYALGRSILELWRGDAEREFVVQASWGQISTSQAISLVVFVGATAVFFIGPRLLGKGGSSPGLASK